MTTPTLIHKGDSGGNEGCSGSGGSVAGGMPYDEDEPGPGGGEDGL